MKKVRGFLQLMRPANIVTSVADVLAGMAIAGFFQQASVTPVYIYPVISMCLSTVGLYGGGIVLNDVFDAGLDKVERPERPIPKGVVSIGEAAALGIFLLVAGIVAALMVSNVSGLLALSIAFAAVIYNKWSKHHSMAGPLNMGLCRGLNLLLGTSIVMAALQQWWFVAFIPIIYIAAITMVSRGEVQGGSKTTLYLAAFLYSIVVIGILVLAFTNGMAWWTIVFLLFFCWMIFSALTRAIRDPLPKNIGKAVKAGVIALIIMDAAWAAAFGSPGIAFLIILLLPLSLWLAKLFAVS